jgi:hypothetical protein
MGMTTVRISGLRGDSQAEIRVLIKSLNEKGIGARPRIRALEQGAKVSDDDVDRALEILRESNFLTSVMPS